MAAGSACPKCGYARKATDTAPAWQCPACGIAVEKYRSASSPASNLAAAKLAPIEYEEVPTRLPLEYRLAAAMLDLLMAGLFLWCWIAPGAWRPTLASELGMLMLMEFFVIHSSIFLVAAGGAGSAGARLTTATVVMLFYIPVAGAFGWWHGGWWPVLGFAWLLTSRVVTMLAGQGTDAFEAKRGRYYWVNGAGIYVFVALVVLIVLPVPRFGFTYHAQYVWDRFWSVTPQEVIAWGFLYFAAQGMMKAIEKPEWIAGWDEHSSRSGSDS